MTGPWTDLLPSTPPALDDIFCFTKDPSGTPISKVTTFEDSIAAIGIKRSIVTLNNAQILALPTTPVVIVPPVANKAYLPILSGLFFKPVGAMTNVNPLGAVAWAGFGSSGYASLNLTDSTVYTGEQEFTAFFAAASNREIILIGPYLYAAGLVSLVTGQFDSADIFPARFGFYSGDGLQFTVSNAAAGDFTGGNAGNELMIQTLYWEMAGLPF